MEEGPGLDAVAGKRRDSFGGRRRRGGVRILRCEIRMARPRLVCVRMEGDTYGHHCFYRLPMCYTYLATLNLPNKLF